MYVLKIFIIVIRKYKIFGLHADSEYQIIIYFLIDIEFNKKILYKFIY